MALIISAPDIISLKLDITGVLNTESILLISL